MRVVIGVSVNSHVARWVPFWESLAMMFASAAAWEEVDTLVYKQGISYDPSDTRNAAIQHAKDIQADAVWLLDDDQSFDPELLRKLLARNVPIVQALTLFRYSPFQPVAFPPHELHDQQDVVDFFLLTDQTGLQPISSGGGGCLLIRREVWETVPAPWFQAGQVYPGRASEDTYFYLKAHAHGFSALVDCDNVSIHWRACGIKPVRVNGRWKTQLVLDAQTFDIPAAIKTGPRHYSLGGRE